MRPMSGLAAWIGWNLAGRLDIQCLCHGFGATYPTYPAVEFAQIEPSYLPTMCLLCASELPTPKKNETQVGFAHRGAHTTARGAGA